MTEKLQQFRRELDELDEQLLDVLSRRLAICREVAAYKAESGIPMMQEQRVAEVKARAAERGHGRGLRREFVLAIYELVIDEACQIEDEIMRDIQGGPAGAN